jgi:hypothetical protein
MLRPTLWLLIILIIVNLNKQIRNVPNRTCAGYNIVNKAVKLYPPPHPLNCCEFFRPTNPKSFDARNLLPRHSPAVEDCP